MAGKKQVGSSSPFPSELFGAKEPSSSKGIFGSVFPPASKVERESSHSELMGSLRKQDSGTHGRNTKQGAPDSNAQSREGNYSSTPNKDRGSIYQDESVGHCYLSSSLYYGGQDVYSNPSSSRASSGSTPAGPFFGTCPHSDVCSDQCIWHSIYEEKCYIALESMGRNLKSSLDKRSHQYKQDGGDDSNEDIHSASRGNWWQGSLYY